MIRSTIVAAIIPMIANFHECGGGTPPPTPPAASATASGTAAVAAAPAPVAKHGGTIVAAGNFNLEIVAKSDGTIRAFPVEAAAGATVAAVPTTAAVTVTVPTAAGQPRPVDLVYTASAEAGVDAAFEGRLANEVVRPGPCIVSIGNAGAGVSAAIGRAPEMIILPVAARGGTIVDVGPAKLEVVAASNGVVQAYPIYPTVESMGAVTADAAITVDVAATTGPARPVTLAWNPGIASFEGRAEAAVFAPGPMNVHVVRGTGRVDVVAPAVVVQPPSALVVTGPQHEGTVIDIEGGHQLEIVVVADGTVQAYPVATYVGSPVIDADVQINVDVPVETGPPQNIALAWNAEIGMFGGAVINSAVVKPGPVRVHVIRRGRTFNDRSAIVLTPRPAGRVRVVAPTANVRANAGGAAAGGVRGGGVAGGAAGVSGGARIEVRIPPPPTVRVNVGGSFSAGGRVR
jgi:hypothetical protein